MLGTQCQQQIRPLREQKLGVGEQLAGETKGPAAPSVRQMGRRGDQAKHSFLPLLSPPLPAAAPHSHGPPPPAAPERSGASETFNSGLMSSGGVPRANEDPLFICLPPGLRLIEFVAALVKQIPNNGHLGAPTLGS